MSLAERENDEHQSDEQVGVRDGPVAGRPEQHFRMVRRDFPVTRHFAPSPALAIRNDPAPCALAYLRVRLFIAAACAAEMWKRASA